jgi:aminoglycoside phosphotransferase family enzyme
MSARLWTTDDKVAFLSNGSNYPGPYRQVKTIQTHFAWVFLRGRYAYKLKKPLRHVAMDYRPRAARKRGCQQELRLNRRLAASVYLAVVPLRSRDGSLRLSGGGKVEDWLVKMHRLRSSQMLDRLLTRRPLSAVELDRLTARLARFFAHARRAPTASQCYAVRLRRVLSANRRALRRAGPSIDQGLVDAVTRAQRDFINRSSELLWSRGARVVEGHGDLRAEHVHIGRPLCVIDCVEFSRELRLLDPAEELACLTLETDRLGHPRLGADLLERYRLVSGDPVDDAVVNFYRSTRALTRAKLCIWHLGDPQFPQARPWIRRACSYVRDADRYTRQARDRLNRGRLGRYGNRPAVQQRRERRTGQDARNRLREQRRNLQHAQLLMRRV